jgi:hypothetical protein
MDSKADLFTNSSNDYPKANLRYRDGVFRALFGEEEYAAELYSLFTGKTCSPDEIEYLTLSNVLINGLVNDLAIFAKRQMIMFAEHQSTRNPNMPLRDFMYSAKVYERYCALNGLMDKIYGEKKLIIPSPKYVVLYNGTKHYGRHHVPAFVVVL